MSILDSLVQSLQQSISLKTEDKKEENNHIHTNQTESYPSWMRPIFAITIRDHRFQSLLERLGPVWKTYVVKWNGTIGTNIDRTSWLLKQKIRKYCQLTSGQLGCYDSHVGLWKDCVRRGQPMFVVEDDVNLNHNDPKAIHDLNKFWERLQTIKLEFDFLYIGHNNKYTPTKYITNFVDSPNIVVPTGCQGLFAYLITPKAAAFLLQNATPYEKPVDVYVQHQFEYYNGKGSDKKDNTEKENEKEFRSYAIYPSPFYVVDVQSDTAK